MAAQKLSYNIVPPCWEIKECNQTTCLAYGNSHEKCFEIITRMASGDIRACEKCPIFLANKNDPNVRFDLNHNVGPSCFIAKPKDIPDSQ